MALSTSISLTEQDLASLWHDQPSVFDRDSVAVHSRPRLRRGYRRAQAAPIEPGRSQAKRLLDAIGAGLALLLFAPLFIVIAIAIKATSAGPVFFKQYRYGYRNRRFRIYKFRTMYADLSDSTGVRQTTDGDPRVTAVGRILRHTSLDELPQLINVLKGDMSLVGPRPHVPGMLAANELYEDLIPYYFQRHCVRPGITGLAQVNGCRGSTTAATAAISRIDYDLEYIETWSTWLDVKIIVRTVAQEFLSGHCI
jgi:exopolysaccharide biosynthesis polyprenyl glycosylphosphotransferase